MSEFELHPRLLADCHRIGQLPVCHLLLHRNASLPWWILVPEVEPLELCQIAEPMRGRVDREIDSVALTVLDQLEVTKLNIAAIGNFVPQLHIHVIGRHPGDACWPNPVWGHLHHERAYTSDELERISSTMQDALPSLTIAGSSAERTAP